MSNVLLVFAVVAASVALILLGVRVRLHNGGGREAGICIRRVAVGRDEAGDNTNVWRFRKTARSRLPRAREFENAGH